MSNSNQNSKLTEPQSGVLNRLGIEMAELKSIKVAIMRRNIGEPNTTTPILRNLDDPSLLVIHYRPDEGVRPIFDREDIVVNKAGQEERKVLASTLPGNEKTHSNSRSSSRSSQSPVPKPSVKSDKKRGSPQPHTSTDYSKNEYRSKEYHSSRRSNSASRKAVYKMSPPRFSHSSRRSRSPYRSPERSRKRERSPPRGVSKDRSSPRYRRRSRSPGAYKGFASDRRRSRTPSKMERGRTPPKYRGPPERRRSRTPSSLRRNSRGRSRSYSPHRRSSRYSRSPHHRDYRYERSKRSRSRSPRRYRYTPERERHDERAYPPRIPNPYFEGAEFWIPDPMMQPRLVPRGMIPPGAFPYAPFRPGIPPMMPPRMPFRPRLVYNSRPSRPKVTAIESSTNTTSSAVSSKDDAAQEEVSESKEEEHSKKNEESQEK